MHLKVLCLTLLITISLFLPAQSVPYPKDYFRNPLGIPMELSANFGELRSNHWHMGLDIRTQQKVNLPVYAAAEGYIAHIGVRSQSFGRFIIINHPNGLSTLYAHLNDFFPELETYVDEQQYAKERWAIEIDFTKNQFPVSKGASIAYSGTSGGSMGPHLHFEIIDTKTDKRLNPLLFNFPTTDNLRPTISKLVVYDRNKSVYEQTPVFHSTKNTDSGYVLPKEMLMKTGLSKISFGLQAYDKMTSGGSQNGIYSAKLFIDDKEQVRFVLDSIDYNETVYINAQIDYKYKYNGGSYLQHLSKLPGDHGPVYKKINGDGVITFTDTLVHNVHIEVSDAHGNISQLKFQIQFDDSLAENFVYRTDKNEFIPNKVNALQKDEFDFYLSEKALYDAVSPVYYSIPEATPYTFSAAHQVGNPFVPMHDDATISIKLNKQVPEQWQDKLFIVRKNNSGVTVRKAVWMGQWMSVLFGGFGKYQIQADVMLPVINELGKGDTVNLNRASRIVFSPTDNFGLKKFDVLLNGEWLLFTNDKSRNWIYEFDERCPFGVHELKARAEDFAGNVTEKTWWFRREAFTPPPPKKKSSPYKKKKAPIKKKN
ncbi:MAG: M23 family metallopeptidase [Chitinophagaceae bacterium]